jgi:arylsulfatase
MSVLFFYRKRKFNIRGCDMSKERMRKFVRSQWMFVMLLFGFTACLLMNGRAIAQDRPNIVLFIGDDISVSDFGAYGHPTIETPHVDKLAANGLRFTNAYLTISSCSPTRTSLITGRYPHNTGAPELHMNSSHVGNLPQFPHELREAGYHTGLAGKHHFNGDVGKSFVDKAGRGGPSGAGYWVSMLKDRPKDKPFFMWFAAIDAHRGWDQSLSEGPHGPEDVIVPPYLVDDKTTRRDLAHYYNEVHRYDTNIGRVIDELKRQGVYENTVLMVISDNGRPFPRDKTWLYDSGIKTPLVVHWPAGLEGTAEPHSLVSVIDLPPTILDLAGVEVPDTFQGVSLTPMFDHPNKSVRDFVFAERNWHTQRYHERMVRYRNFVYIRNNLPELVGMNLVHYVRDKRGGYGGKERAFSALVDHWRAGNANRAQKVVVRTPRPKEMLFNVEDDPHQLNNLAGNPKYADELEYFRTVLNQWSNKTGDTIPDVEEMTPDRGPSRETWEGKTGSGRPGGGVVPGESTEAWTINKTGPIHTEDIETGP